MTGADRGVSRRGGCRCGWGLLSGYTSAVFVGTLAKGGRRGEGDRTKGHKSPTVRYWRMISCLHSSEPVSNEGEMSAGPIWNNRIPFAIVFLSVSLFLDPTVGTNASVTIRVCACIDRKFDGGRKREGAPLSAPRLVMPGTTVHDSRAITLSAHRHGSPTAALCGPRTYSPRACIMLLLRFSWKASSTGSARDVKEL